MDMQWARDGAAGAIFILQAGPETVQSRAGRTIQRYALKGRSRVLATGRSIGQRIGAGAARVIRDAGEIDRKSTRLNSSHSQISYAVFCLKKKKISDRA